MRNYESRSKDSWRILELQKTIQESQLQARDLRGRNNELRRKLATAASMSGDAEGDIAQPTFDKKATMDEARHLKGLLADIEEKEKELQREIDTLALGLPNLTGSTTPEGTEPTLITYIPESLDLDVLRAKEGRSHVDIGSELDLLDFAGAATASGWGWYYLKNEAALLEQALLQYTLHTLRERGWTVVSPPSIVYAHIAAACGFQPRDQNGEQQIYAIDQPDKDKESPSRVLAGTAEIALAGMKAAATLEEKDLPLKTVGVNRCYRAEAGARGVDTKGLYRVHEFTKVEMFAWTLPSRTGTSGFGADDATTSSADEVFEEMLSIQKSILEDLGMQCRVLEMPSTDLGASASRKIDIEAFFPSRRDTKSEGWGEVTSLSSCADYQSRRLATRVRLGTGRELDFPYTLNGTALAVPRVLAAILENGWDEEQKGVRVPEVLRKWMGGEEWIMGKKGKE